MKVHAGGLRSGVHSHSHTHGHPLSSDRDKNGDNADVPVEQELKKKNSGLSVTGILNLVADVMHNFTDGLGNRRFLHVTFQYNLHKMK